MTRKYIGVVPFWPLGTADDENYFLLPMLVAKKEGYGASIFVLSSLSSILDFYRSLSRSVIVHCQTSSRFILLLLGLLFLRRKDCSVIWTPHTSFGKGYPSKLPFNFFRVFSFVFKRLAKILAITEYEEEYLQNLGYKNVSYLPLVVGEERAGAREKSRRGRGLNLLFIGGDRPIKGLIGVLKAVSVLEKLGVNVTLRVLGKIGSDFTKQYSHLISPKTKFLGWVEPTSPLLAEAFEKSDCYVNNSFYEGLPLATLEAATAGLFLCLPGLPTLRRLFGKNARYHDPNNPSQMVKSILFYFYNRGIGDKYVENNRQLVEEFSSSKFEARFSRILRGLI